jgi:hypothetical protein
MLYSVKFAIYNEIRAKHVNNLFGQNTEFLNDNRDLHKVTTKL